MTVERRRGTSRDVLPLLIGIVALIVGSALGWDSRIVDALVSPPAIARAILAGLSVVLAVWLLAGSIRHITQARSTETGQPDIRLMVRGVRLAFLALAAACASAGWVLGHPLPIVIALVIAGVDVIETSFLLLVSGPRH